MIDKLSIRLQPTSSGLGVYCQILSDDMLVNVVLIAGAIELHDDRREPVKQ